MAKPNDFFDICVIGAGAAGLSVAAGTSQLGLKTVLIEKGDMGGDCLNTGCIPSKALLAAAHAAQTIRSAQKFGLRTQDPVIDFPAVKNHVRSVVETIAPIDSAERFERLGVTVIRGAAAFTDQKTLTVNDTNTTARIFVLATGSRPSIPAIPGLKIENAFTNETIFELKEQPEHLIIVGGGPIGLEMAQAHRRLGCRVTVLNLGPILPKDDPELVAIIREKLISEGISLKEGDVRVNRVDHPEKNRVTVYGTEDGHKFDVSGSHLLVAAGRSVVTNDLGLEKAGIAYNKQGIIVNKALRTSNPRVYAIGDCVEGPQFTHVGGYHAAIFIRRAVFKSPFAKTDYSALPWVTYTDPELANVGLTERGAREKYGDSIKVSRWAFAENDRAQTSWDTAGLIKVTTLKNGRIIGAGIAGPQAGELISLWGLAISKKLKIGAAATMIMPYPTLSEVSKRVAGAYFTPALFSDKTRKLVNLLKRI